MPSPRRSLRFLITAGPTHEYLDPVRYLGNASSGRLGYAVAAAARARGHRVVLVSGPTALPGPAGVRRVRVVSARDMDRACRREFPQCDVLVMAAAVADYRPASRARGKLRRSGRERPLRLIPNPDILAGLARRSRGDQVLIGFALETGGGRARAIAKARRKGVDGIFLDSPKAIGAAQVEFQFLSPAGRRLGGGRMPKAAAARTLVKWAETQILGRRML